jgi:hypothetical protein
MIRIAFVLIAASFALGTPIHAQDATAPGADDGRFNFHRVQDGFLRLDTRTGQVSTCTRQSAGWACRAVADERAALETEIARLQSDNAALKKEMLAKGLPLPGGIKADPPPVARGGDQELKLPSNAELERMMAFMEKVWRRLVEMMVSIQRDMPK